MKSNSVNWSNFSDAIDKLSAWNKHTFATWWLWVPLMFATLGYLDPRNDRADMYDVARTAPRFVREGVVDDLGRWMKLKMAQGGRRISCEAARLRWRDTNCLPRERFPLYVKVTLVDYKGHWLIISASDKNREILSEEKQLNYLKMLSKLSKSRDPNKIFVQNFALAFVGGGALTLLALRRRRKLQQAANAVG